MTIKEVKQACIHYQAVAMTSHGSVKQNAIEQYKYYKNLLNDLTNMKQYDIIILSKRKRRINYVYDLGTVQKIRTSVCSSFNTKELWYGFGST